jgi:hypothetical protein
LAKFTKCGKNCGLDGKTISCIEKHSINPFQVQNMLSFLPTKTPDGSFHPVFNTNLWSYVNGFVTFADLLGYAQLSISNVWSASQLFADGLYFTGSINNVSSEAFGYLSNVTGDIQAQFQSIFTLLVNWTTDESSDTNLILGANTGIDGGMNSTELIANNAVLGSLSVSSAHIGSLSVGSLVNQDALRSTCVWLWNASRMYPLQSTTPVAELTLWDLNQSMFVSMLPSIEVLLLDSTGVCLWSHWNASGSTMHFISINLPPDSGGLDSVVIIRH